MWKRIRLVGFTTVLLTSAAGLAFAQGSKAEKETHPKVGATEPGATPGETNRPNIPTGMATGSSENAGTSSGTASANGPSTGSGSGSHVAK